MNITCPKCNSLAEERYLLTSTFMYCTKCKDDISMLKKEDSSFKISDKVYGKLEWETPPSFFASNWLTQGALAIKKPLNTYKIGDMIEFTGGHMFLFRNNGDPIEIICNSGPNHVIKGKQYKIFLIGSKGDFGIETEEGIIEIFLKEYFE